MDWIVGLSALAIVVILAVLFNLLVSARLRVREAWSSIEVQLQRRASLIPNLVETVKGYAAFERGTLQSLTAARAALGAATGPQAAAGANESLTEAVHKLVAIAEAYPDLKANQNFAQLQTDLADTENQIAFARNYYNGAVEIYNTRVQQFPTLIVARVFNFASAEFFVNRPSGIGNRESLIDTSVVGDR
jgi:LemA protein